MATLEYVRCSTNNFPVRPSMLRSGSGADELRVEITSSWPMLLYLGKRCVAGDGGRCCSARKTAAMAGAAAAEDSGIRDRWRSFR